MIQAAKITITRAEGPTALCGISQTFEGPDCWAEANRYLHRMSISFPKEGGYDKHDFRVEFADGETWDGRLDCKHFSCEGSDLDVAKHVAGFARFYAGLACPSHMTEEKYRKVLSHYEDVGAMMREFLDTYEVPA